MLRIWECWGWDSEQLEGTLTLTLTRIPHWQDRVTEGFAEASSLEAGGLDLRFCSIFTILRMSLNLSETQFPPARKAGRFIAELCSTCIPQFSVSSVPKKGEGAT